MSTMHVDRDRCTLCGECLDACPFDGIQMTDSGIEFTELCRLCQLCIDVCPTGAISLHEIEAKPELDRAEYQGVLVFAEQRQGRIHPVTYELIGQALELASQLDHDVAVFLAGHNVSAVAHELLHYGIDAVYTYDHPALEHFRIEPYTHAMANLIEEIKPNIILMGATHIGRTLAPRVAARRRTGLTADCTTLSVKDNGDLVQTRPAFGGNVMAQIVTPHHRPQMATVRYQVMSPAPFSETIRGKVIPCHLADELLESNIERLEFHPHTVSESIMDADVIVAAGRGVDKLVGMELLAELAALLDGAIGVTRPLVECGWADYTQQIGMSGRTVRPRLYIACGISGAIQHVAGMRGADYIMAINHDPKAPIFDIAHIGLVGDLYEVVPALIDQIRQGAALSAIQ